MAKIPRFACARGIVIELRMPVNEKGMGPWSLKHRQSRSASTSEGRDSIRQTREFLRGARNREEGVGLDPLRKRSSWGELTNGKRFRQQKGRQRMNGHTSFPLLVSYRGTPARSRSQRCFSACQCNRRSRVYEKVVGSQATRRECCSQNAS